MTKTRFQHPAFYGACIFALAACSDAAGESSDGRIGLGTVEQAVTTLTQPITTTSSNHAVQSETSIAVGKTSGGGQTIAVAYNDVTDPTHITYPTSMTRSITAGASLMGWAYSLTGGSSWTTGRLSPPAGYDVLWGDPSITVLPSTPTVMFMSNLGMSHSIFTNNPPPTNGAPLTPSVCLAKSTDGGQTFSMYQCVDLPNPNPAAVTNDCDGPTTAADSSGRIMTSCFNYMQGTGAFWLSPSTIGSFSSIANPFTCSVASHVLLRSYGGAIYAGAQCSTGGIQVAKYTTSWSSPVTVSPTTNMVTGVGGVAFATKGTVRTLTFDFQVGDASPVGSDNFRIFYTQQSGGVGKYWIAGTYCNTSLSGCVSPSAWSTQSTTGDQFMPAVGIATPFPTTVPGGLTVTYWSRENDPTGDQTQVMALGQNIGSTGMSKYAVTSLQTVCPEGQQYWGDYNDIKYLGLSGRQPQFLTTFTDSSLGCTTQWQFTSTHQHVTGAVHVL